MVAREDLHLQGSQILDLWGLLFPLNHSPENGLPSRSSTERRLVLPAAPLILNFRLYARDNVPQMWTRVQRLGNPE